MSDRATNLRDAYRICNVEPLQGETLKYYVDLSDIRTTEAIKSVSTTLNFLDRGECTTILFTGHRGCGKSTELKRIQSTWEKNYKVIYLEANQEIDLNDASYTDLYLVVIKQVESKLRELKLGFDQELLTNFENWFKEVTEETEETVEKSVSTTSGASLQGQVPLINLTFARKSKWYEDRTSITFYCC